MPDGIQKQRSNVEDRSQVKDRTGLGLYRRSHLQSLCSLHDDIQDILSNESYAGRQLEKMAADYESWEVQAEVKFDSTENS